MEHTFSIEMNSKKHVKHISVSNESHDRVLFEGTINYSESSSTSASLNVAMDYTPYYIGFGIIAVAITGVVGYIVFRRRKKAKRASFGTKIFKRQGDIKHG